MGNADLLNALGEGCGKGKRKMLSASLTMMNVCCPSRVHLRLFTVGDAAETDGKDHFGLQQIHHCNRKW